MGLSFVPYKNVCAWQAMGLLAYQLFPVSLTKQMCGPSRWPGLNIIKHY